MRNLIFSFFIFLSALSVRAESLGDVSRSARSRAMGGVYVPFAEGADSIFVNPAALAYSPLLDIKLVDLSLALNSFTVDNVVNFQNINTSDPSSYSNFYGHRVWLQATGKTGIAIPYFGMGYVNSGQASLELHNPAFPEFETYFVQDEAIYMSGAIPLGPLASMGLSFKRINRWGGSTQNLTIGDVAGSNNLQDIGNRFANKGQGYGIDMALMTQLQLPVLKPTLALVAQDLGFTAFNKTAGDSAPETLAQNVTLAGGLKADLFLIDTTFGVELRHLTESDIQIGNKLHLGAELSLPLIDVRAGYNQGYFTYGVGFNFLIFHFDATSYTEELGVYPGQEGDARYMASLNIDLSFDANFSFTDNIGKKRKLKQRR